MKRYLIFICFFITTDIFAQSLCTKTKLIKGIIINRYSRNDMGFYCEMETNLLHNNDTILFYQDAGLNSYLLKHYPTLKSSIGKSSEYDYDYLNDFSNRVYNHNLTISDYNFHTEDVGGKVVSSLSFYYKNDCINLYSAYQFTGTVVFYYGLNPFTKDNEEDCFCPSVRTNNMNFAILKETKSLKPLTDEQIKNNSLIRSGIRSIKVFYCE